MKNGKKLLSTLLAVVMVVASVNLPIKKVDAESGNSVKMTLNEEKTTAQELYFGMSAEPTSVADDANVVFGQFTNDIVQNSDNLFLVNDTIYDNLVEKNPNYERVYPLGEESGVWRNNDKLSGIPLSPWSYTGAGKALKIDFEYTDNGAVTFQEGDIVIIKGTWKDITTGYTFEMEDVKFVYRGGTGHRWDMIDAENVELTQYDVDTARLLFHNDELYKAVGDASDKCFESIGTNSGVFLNGTERTLPSERLGTHDYSAAVAEWGKTIWYDVDNCGYTMKVGDTVTIKGIWTAPNGYTFSLKEQTFECLATAGANRWDEITPTVSTEETWTTFTGSITDKNGTSIDGATFQVSEQTPTSAKISLEAAASEGDVVKISGEFATETHKFTLEETKYYFNGTSWEVQDYIEVVPTLIDSDDFRTNTDKAWLDMGYAYTGTFTPADDASGVWFNGEKMSAPSLAMNQWYTTYSSIYLGTVTAESTLKIDGIFVNEEGTKIKITNFNLKRVDGKWELDVELGQLEKPVLTISGSVVSWSEIANATGYEIYINGTLKDTVVTLSYDLSNTISETGTYSITVKAICEDQALTSEASDAINYSYVAPTEVVPELIYDTSVTNFREQTDRIWIKLGSQFTGTYSPVGDASGVSINGTLMPTLTLAMNAYYTEYACVQFNGLHTATDDTKLVINGTFQNENGEKIHITDFKVKRVNGLWELDVEMIQLSAPVISIDETGIVSWVAVENATQYEVYCDGSTLLGTVTDGSCQFDLSTANLGLGTYSITVKAVGGSNTTSATSETQTYEVKPKELGTMVVGSINEAKNNYEGFYVNTTGVEDGNMTTNGQYVGIDTESGIFINGNKVDKAYILSTGWLPFIHLGGTYGDAASIPADATMVVKGTFRYDLEQFSVEELTFKWMGTSWAMVVPLETVYDVSLTPNNDDAHKSNKNAYVNVNTDTTTGFSANINFTQNIFDGQIKVNDDVLSEDEYKFMTSYAPESYYVIGFVDESRTWKVGDKLTISGQFVYAGDNTSGIRVAEYTAWYDGTQWTTTEMITRPGDFNYDADWTSIDLVRFKHLMNEGTAGQFTSLTELDGVDGITKDDVQILRYIILGLRQIIDGRLTDKYLTDATLNILADGPPNYLSEDNIKTYFDAGFTTMVMTEDYSVYAIDNDNNSTMYNATTGTIDEDYAKYIETALKYGDVMVRNYGTDTATSLSYFTKPDGTYLYKELYDLGVRQFYIWDEPTPKNNGSIWGIGASDGEIPSIVTMAKQFTQELPADAMFHVNLLPSYGAGSGKLFDGTITYSEYVDQYVNDVLNLQELNGYNRTLSVDNYPLLNNNTIRASYLTDLWKIANSAKGTNATVNYCIQTYYDTEESSDTAVRKPENRADITFQTNTGLALGAQSFEYFQYYQWEDENTTPTKPGIINSKIDLYDEVQSVNKELREWEHIFLSFNWNGVKTYNVASGMKTGVTELSNLSSISVSATQATLVGEYEYSKNSSEKAYMITNFTEPSANTEDVVTITVTANQEVLVYQNGIGKWMNADAQGQLQLTLPAGGGAFVIPQ